MSSPSWSWERISQGLADLHDNVCEIAQSHTAVLLAGVGANSLKEADTPIKGEVTAADATLKKGRSLAHDFSTAAVQAARRPAVSNGTGSRLQFLVSSSHPSVTSLEAVLCPLANEIKLSYIQCGPMSQCVRATLAAQGFRQVSADAGNDWTIAWGSTLPAAQMSAMTASQAHNHIPGWHRLNNKGTLAEMAEKCRTDPSKKRLADHVPKSWVLPGGLADLVRDSESGGGPYISKPIGGTRGKGIKLWKKITEDSFKGVSRVVVQRYIKNPHLIKGKKYDLRLYVAATSACPMRIFLHQQGYARFCSEAYDLDRTQDLFRHVTNSNFQKAHDKYDLNRKSSRVQAAGNKWHVEVVKEHWRALGRNLDKVIWERIKEAVMMAFVMFETLSFNESRRLAGSKNFCLFGIDVMLDENLHPWLLELNGLPSTGTDSPVDIEIKAAVLNDLLSLVGLCSREPSQAQREVEVQLLGSLSRQDSGKRGMRGGMEDKIVYQGQGPQRVPPIILDGAIVQRQLEGVMKRKVTAEHVELVLQWEREQARRRGWCACFPCPAMGKYTALLKFREANDVMLAWMKTQMMR